MGKFNELPISTKLFKNIDESALTDSYAALENAFITEAGGVTRFPGLKTFVDFGNKAPIYLGTIHQDLIAVGGDGRVRHVNKNGNFKIPPGPQVLGGRRVIFDHDKSNTYMAAGAQIIAYDGSALTVLSDSAPNATHVGCINSFVIANEVNSERFFYSDAGDPRTWEGINVFSATARPDDITAMVVTDFNEIIVAGLDSIEQFNPLLGGTVPFIRQWAIGDGLSEPYTFCFLDNAVWGLNKLHEFTRFSGQSGQVMSGDIGKDIADKFIIKHNGSFEDAWASPLIIKGQAFALLQLPKAKNNYGSLGVTYLLDIRKNKYCELYGWDNVLQLPALWPGVSVQKIWGRTYIGGYGKIYELTENAYNIAGDVSRLYARTAPYSEMGLIRIDSMRVTMKRGVGNYTKDPKLAMRVNRDGRGFGRWQFINMGKAGDNNFMGFFGDQGDGYTWQFEFMVTDDCDVEIRKIEAETTSMVR